MSPLPTVALPTERVTLSDGQAVEVRGLSFAESAALGDLEDAAATMRAAIAYATGTRPDEVAAWCEATPFEDVRAVADAVYRISKMGPGLGEASGAPSSSANGTPSPSSSPSGLA